MIIALTQTNKYLIARAQPVARIYHSHVNHANSINYDQRHVRFFYVKPDHRQERYLLRSFC